MLLLLLSHLLLCNCLLLRHVPHHACSLLWVHGWTASPPLLVCLLKLYTTTQLLLNLRWQLRLHPS